jgi:hypothetical protein
MKTMDSEEEEEGKRRLLSKLFDFRSLILSG